MILRGHCEDAMVFDAFAGTGAIGLEAVSRGARKAVMVEKDRGIAEILRKNVETLGVQGRSEVFVGDALGAGALARCPRPLHLAFFDPPYPLIEESLGWARVSAQVANVAKLLDESGYVVLRTPWPFYHLYNADGTPWREESGEAAEAPWKKGGGKHVHKRTRLRHDGEEWEEVWSRDRDGVPARGGEGAGGGRRASGGPDPRDIDPELLELGLEPEEEEPTVEGCEAAPKPERRPVDLRIAGTKGPETHVYASMAVHLYMRE